MDLLAQYTDSDEEVHSTTTTATVVVSSAPPVANKGTEYYPGADTHKLMYNMEYHNLYAPMVGPLHSSVLHSRSTTLIAPGQNNMFTGYVSDDAVNDFTFQEQMYGFYSKGYAVNPANPTQMVGNYNPATADIDSKKEKRKRMPFGDPADVTEYQGPWAPYEEDFTLKKQVHDTSEAIAVFLFIIEDILMLL